MSNFVLGYYDQGFKASYSGGVWRDNLDTQMLKRQLLTAVARTLDLTELVLDITLPESLDVEVLGLCNHNITSSGSYRWQCFSDTGRLNEVYDSGIITPYSYFKELVHNTTCDTTESAITDVYWRLTINDTNSDGYIQLGRLFIGKRFDVGYNMDYGLTMSVDVSNTQIEESSVGIEAFVQSIRLRNVAFTHSLLGYSAGNEFYKLQLSEGVSQSCLFEFDPENKENGIRTFIGRNQVLTPLTFPHFNLNSFGFNIKEII